MKLFLADIQTLGETGRFSRNPECVTLDSIWEKLNMRDHSINQEYCILTILSLIRLESDSTHTQEATQEAFLKRLKKWRSFSRIVDLINIFTFIWRMKWLMKPSRSRGELSSVELIWRSRAGAAC